MLQHCMYLVIIYSTLFHHICTCSYLRLLLCFVISHSIYIFFLMLSLIFFFFFFNDTATPEIYTSVHTLSLHDALPICDAPARRAHHPARLLPDARGLEPSAAAVLLPFEHRELGFSAADQPGIEQLARLGFAGLGAAIIDDDVIFVRRANARHRHLPADHAQPGLDRLRRRPGGARRAIEAGADLAADAPRRVVDGARDAAPDGG